MATIKTLADLEAEDAAGFQNPEPTAAEKERERIMLGHRAAGAKAYADGTAREACPLVTKGPARAAWLAGFDNAKLLDTTPESEEPDEDEDDDSEADDKTID